MINKAKCIKYKNRIKKQNNKKYLQDYFFIMLNKYYILNKKAYEIKVK